MQELIEVIRAATAADATPEQKGAGVLACRTIAAALDTEPGKPLAMPSSTPAMARGSIDQVLDLMIARLSVIAKARDDSEQPAATADPSAPPAPAHGAITPSPTVPAPSRGLRIPIATGSALKGAATRPPNTGQRPASARSIPTRPRNMGRVPSRKP